MCFSSPSLPDPKNDLPITPAPPPPPAPTAQGLTIGKDRKSSPLQQLFANALAGRKPRNPLRIDMGGGVDAAAGNGLNIPQG